VSESIQPEEKQESDQSANVERREALRKLGAFAGYTAPVMLAMLKSERAVAQTVL
jgi:hypothetical protein